MFPREFALTVNVGGAFGVKLFNQAITLGASPKTDAGKGLVAVYDSHADALLTALGAMFDEAEPFIIDLMAASDEQAVVETVERWSDEIDRSKGYFRAHGHQVRGEQLAPRQSQRRRIRAVQG
jgi:hypothetical protein